MLRNRGIGHFNHRAENSCVLYFLDALSVDATPPSTNICRDLRSFRFTEIEHSLATQPSLEGSDCVVAYYNIVGNVRAYYRALQLLDKSDVSRFEPTYTTITPAHVSAPQVARAINVSFAGGHLGHPGCTEDGGKSAFYTVCTSINGHDQAMIIDTGFMMTIVSQIVADALGLKPIEVPNGPMKGTWFSKPAYAVGGQPVYLIKIMLKRLSVGDTQFENIQGGIDKTNYFNMLGYDILSKFDNLYLGHDGDIIFNTDNTVTFTHCTPMALEIQKPHGFKGLSIHITVNGKDTLALIDSGSDGIMTVFDKSRFSKSRPNNDTVTFNARGEALKTRRFDALVDIAGYQFKTVGDYIPTTVAGLPATIGAGMLHKADVLLDFKQARFCLNRSRKT
jgi:predicted aspartyl protease